MRGLKENYVHPYRKLYVRMNLDLMANKALALCQLNFFNHFPKIILEEGLFYDLNLFMFGSMCSLIIQLTMK